jgi:hypothetical protein
MAAPTTHPTPLEAVMQSFLPVLIVCLGTSGDCLGFNLEPVASFAECQAAVIEARPKVEVQFRPGWIHSMICEVTS